MATKKATTVEPVISQEEHSLLVTLEQLDRSLMKNGEEKAETLAEFKLEKDGLEKERDAVLKKLDDYRNGIVALPFDD